MEKCDDTHTRKDEKRKIVKNETMQNVIDSRKWLFNFCRLSYKSI